MNQYAMSAEEYAFLCFASGAKTIYGIKQFHANPEPEQIAKNLSKKRYIKRDFDGNTVISKELSEMISVCVNCERLFILNLSSVYYCKENRIVKLFETTDGYELYQIDSRQMWAEILGALPTCEKLHAKDLTDIVLTKKELETFKESLGKTDLYSLVTMRFDGADTVAKSFMVLSSENGLYCLEPQVKNLENVVHVVKQNEDEIRQKIEKMKAEE